MQPITAQNIKDKKDLVTALQVRMNDHFLEHRMFNVNDALTSILALCDLEQMRSMGKVKKYIEKVNDLLEDVRVYQNQKLFNVNHVIENIINIIEDNFKDIVEIEKNLKSISLMVEGDQCELEHLLLYLFIESIASKKDSIAKVNINLSQIGKEAIIEFKNDHFPFTEEVRKELDRLKESFFGMVRIDATPERIKVIIELSLQSDRNDNKNSSTNSRVEIKDIQLKERK